MLESGSLKHFNIPDLINILGQSKKTGELVIKTRHHEGSLFFRDGILFHALNGPISGEEALYELMGLDNGDFSFNDKQINFPQTIHKDTAELLKEGSLRSEMVSSLSKYSIKTSPNSKFQFKSTYPENLTSYENAVFEVIKHNKDSTIIQIFEQVKLSTVQFANSINGLIGKDIIELIKPEEEAFYGGFQHIVGVFYTEFTSISGLKMSSDLDKKIQDLILLNNWNLDFKDGKIYSNELFNFPIDDQWKIYSAFLNELFAYFGKIYGSDFVTKVINGLLNSNPELKTLLDRLNRIN